ncbi:hypothetical protein CFN78_06875 [Amycolatopsis antarctica]|uniref:Uncharacterized protein n=1 Tax=Amycolatopsis antarctica TaxID=1854586 RepID=A0A263D665_9PSEU|nr:hypothetical protein [Amycolatopsis antarctica]OZM74004.1 hypothetical protein CFN78_06875 [Amycolatopsis antarctica]
MTNTRPAPPPLEPVAPPCSICATETAVIDNSFQCDRCECSWPLDGIGIEDGDWDNPDTEQCRSVIQPFADAPARYDDIRAVNHRCYREHGHDLRHTNPDLSGTWSSDDPNVREIQEATR